MNKKLVMSFSAFILGITGIIFTFLPSELLAVSGFSYSELPELLIQLTGALYFAFAMLNWMSRGSHLGGIYNRPVVVANLTHFSVAGLAILKQLISSPASGIFIWIAGILYITFAILFTWILFNDPVNANRKH